MGEIKDKSIDMIFADPPYYLSNDGFSCSGGKMVSVNKGEWDKGNPSVLEKINIYSGWMKECKRVLKDDGSIWISGTLHNIYTVGVVLELLNFKILNNITWQKTNPPPNLSCRYFTHSTETVLWARKNIKDNKHCYNYELMKKTNSNKQMKDVWSGSLTRATEKRYGKYPTQKPEYLLERIILSSTKEGDTIMDPFNGSGTTGVVARKLKRGYIGIDISIEALEITVKRKEDIDNEQRF